MTHVSCANCGTQIVDHTTMQEQGGESYCCRNCAAMVAGTTYEPGAPRCAHCEMPIVDVTTKVEGARRTFCCNNCAIAMAAMDGSARPAR